MKIITILGSPRKKGNTATVLNLFEELVTAQHHQVERINLIDCNVQGCLGCNHCQDIFDEPGCIQTDDAPGIFQKLFAADAIVYASPVYSWSVTAQMKALLDRHYCLVKWQADTPVRVFLQGKRAALLSTCGGTLEGDADLIQTMFDREMQYLRCEITGHYILPACSTPDQLGPRAMTMAQKLAQDITA